MASESSASKQPGMTTVTNLDDLDYVNIGHWAGTYAHCFALTQSLATGSPYKSEDGSTTVSTRLITPALASRIPPGTGSWESPSIGLTLTDPGTDLRAILHRTTWATVARWLSEWPAAERNGAVSAARLIAHLTNHPGRCIEPWDDQTARATKVAHRTTRLERSDTARITAADQRIRALAAARLAPDSYALF